MRIIFFVGSIFFTLVTQAQQMHQNINLVFRKALPGSDTIYYNPTQKLQWPDFTGIPQMNTRPAAITSSGFGYDAFTRSNSRGSFITVNVYAFFNRSKSWVKPTNKTAYILGHEQLHFNISYIGAMLFTQKLKAAKFTANNYSKLLDTLYTSSYREMNALQNQYDSETNNGILKDKQAVWQTKINTLVATMQQRRATVIHLPPARVSSTRAARR